jgi:hypothetical protein
MTLMCVACRTENRDAAKFCKGCGGKLVSLPSRSAAEEEALEDAWGATLHASLVDDAGRSASRARGPSHRASRPQALLSAAAEPVVSQPQRIDTARQQLPVTRDRSVRWVMLAALAIVVATGGAYVYRGLHPRSVPATVLPQPDEPAAASVTATPMPAVAAPAPEPVAVPAVDAALPAAPAPAPTEAPPAPLPSASSPVASTVAATPRKAPSRKSTAASAPVVVPHVAAAPIAPAAPAPTPVAPPAPADPSQACAGRNFIATAQCLAAQCAKAEFTAHARCDAVRRQQQIEEEKRNPVNAG